MVKAPALRHRRFGIIVLMVLVSAMLGGGWGKGETKPTAKPRQRNLQKGFVLFLNGDYIRAESLLRTHLSESPRDRYGLASFLLGATLAARSFTEAERTAELLEEGVRHFREAKRWGGFRLPDNLKPLISPRILNVYYRSLTR